MSNKNDINIQDLYLLKQGNENAFQSIFRKYNAKIYHFALSVLQDKGLAEDITQDVFLILWNHKADIIPEKNFQTYLYTIARNLTYREIEKKALAFRYEDYVKDTYAKTDSSAEEIIDAESMENFILQLVEQFPEARKKIFLLRFTEGLSNKDVATRLSISEGNVAQQIQRSLTFIKSCLKKYITLFSLLCLW